MSDFERQSIPKEVTSIDACMSDADFSVFFESFKLKMKNRPYDNALEELQMQLKENDRKGISFTQEQKDLISQLAIKAGGRNLSVL